MKNEVKVSEFAEKWIKIAIAGKSLSQQCAVKNAICNHVLPIIGDLPIRCVEYSDAALVMAAVAHYSYSLRSKVLSNMRRMFEMEDRPARCIHLPRR